MTGTATSWLNDLTSLFTPTATQFDGAKGHKASIETRLDYVLGVYRMFEIGSLRHGTGVWQYSDADYLVSLKGIQPSSPLTMLTKVKEALQVRFTSTTITIRQPAVVCHFSDGIVEVVPGYIASGGGYMIADPRGGWMKSFPEEHNEYVNKINAKHSGGGAKKLARHLKIWKYKRNVPVSSCYLEMRAAKFLSEETAYVPIIDLHFALKRQSIELASMNDPTGLGSRFGSCSSDSTKADALSKLDTAVLRSSRALDHHFASDHDKAIEQLKLLFNR